MNGSKHIPHRQISVPAVTPTVKILLIICGVFFLVATGARNFAAANLALHPLDFHPWQLVTAVFLHFDLSHLLFNLLALWMFGSAVETVLGQREFLTYCLITGVGANVVWQIAAILTGNPTMLLGISGVVFGLLFAYGKFFPESIILAFFVFPMKAKNFVLLFGGLELWLLFSSPGGNVAHLVHVAGAIIGAIYLTQADGFRATFRRLWLRFNFWRKTRHLKVLQGQNQQEEAASKKDKPVKPRIIN